MMNSIDAFCLDGASQLSRTLRDSRSYRHVPLEARGAKAESKTKVYLQDPSIQEGKPSALESDFEASVEEGKDGPDVKDSVRKVGRKIGISAVYGFSFFMNIVGLYFTAGLLLNLFGYAYEFSFEEGYKIDTIENKRIQRQFEQESRRYEREYGQRISQLSVEAPNMFSSETVAELSKIAK